MTAKGTVVQTYAEVRPVVCGEGWEAVAVTVRMIGPAPSRADAVRLANAEGLTAVVNDHWPYQPKAQVEGLDARRRDDGGEVVEQLRAQVARQARMIEEMQGLDRHR